MSASNVTEALQPEIHREEIVAAASLLTFTMILIRAHGDEPADGDARIQQTLEGIYELRPGYVTVYGDWSGSVAILRGVSSTRGNSYLPDRFAVCTVDFKNRELTYPKRFGLPRCTA